MDTLIQSLINPECYPHRVKMIDVVETHISWVILTGDIAYKIKKPVNLGFLDFSDLDKRHYYCLQELQLNRRLAANLYINVVAIHGNIHTPTFTDSGPVIEYAVKMHQFPQANQLDRLLSSGGLTSQHIESLATTIAEFHQTIDSADKHSSYGEPLSIQEAVLDNISNIKSLLDRESVEKSNFVKLANISKWGHAEFDRIRDLLRQRKDGGFVRECHGDMHLRNIVLLENEIVIFDCLEFNQQLRWVDVISELAFIVMDLQDRNQHAYANLLLNRYLSLTGDYSGLQVFRYYLLYRAMVRAKVSCLSAAQSDIEASAKTKSLQEFNGYLSLAEKYTQHATPSLYITHGLSGSGKSYLAKKLLKCLPLICLQSDVERKRIHGLSQLAKSESGLYAGIYSRDNTENTYVHLHNLAELLLLNDWSVLVDATFLKKRHRDLFSSLARKLQCNFIIFDCVAETERLHKRLAIRQKKGSEVSEANSTVLETQLSSQQGLTEDEREYVIRVDTGSDVQISHILEKIKLTNSETTSSLI